MLKLNETKHNKIEEEKINKGMCWKYLQQNKNKWEKMKREINRFENNKKVERHKT